MVWESKRFFLLLMAVLAAGMPGVAAAGAADQPNQDIINMVIDALKSNDPQMQSGAIAIVRDIPGPEVTKALVQELPKLPATGQVQLLSVLGDRGDVTALPAVIEAGKSQDESVRVAALRALGQLGGVANVALLAERAAASKGAEQKAAREGLYRLRGAEVDAAILQSLPSADPGVKAELIDAIGERNIAGAVETLLKAGKDENRKVRLESFRVLRIVAKPEDMPALVNLLLETDNEADRGEAEKMVAAVAHKIEDKTRQSAAVQAVLPNVKDAAGSGVAAARAGADRRCRLAADAAGCPGQPLSRKSRMRRSGPCRIGRRPSRCPICSRWLRPRRTKCTRWSRCGALCGCSVWRATVPPSRRSISTRKRWTSRATRRRRNAFWRVWRAPSRWPR